MIAPESGEQSEHLQGSAFIFQSRPIAVKCVASNVLIKCLSPQPHPHIYHDASNSINSSCSSFQPQQLHRADNTSCHKLGLYMEIASLAVVPSPDS